ncbi:hypothetical protein RhiXN_00666 [Rhizoctonia solani]|uniref:Rdx family n=1 Tax=Rhizoctonia solani TaxID=456999 RepID=A0A8H7LNL0_9AGAM|nr:uncharacterized protein RhiXN_00666 [Rhizoctonia solani]KAF8680096.1 Rdx family [Rhizoctonia solani]QRW19260.1 hypothetical protein RhiXN_00666 [Rhizoctonia solani]
MADCETDQCPPAPVYHAPAEVHISTAATTTTTTATNTLDPTTFIAPRSGPAPSVVIEFCDRYACSADGMFFSPSHLIIATECPDNRLVGISFGCDNRVGPVSMRDNRTTLSRLHRATWTQTELFLTFPPPALSSITLVPLNSTETGGRFRVWLLPADSDDPKLVWDRKTEGGFPELKVLKQRIRDVIQPGTSLGHSDAKPTA